MPLNKEIKPNQIICILDQIFFFFFIFEIITIVTVVIAVSVVVINKISDDELFIVYCISFIMHIPIIWCLNIYGTHVTANNFTSNNVVFFCFRFENSIL